MVARPQGTAQSAQFQPAASSHAEEVQSTSLRRHSSVFPFPTRLWPPANSTIHLIKIKIYLRVDLNILNELDCNVLVQVLA